MRSSSFRSYFGDSGPSFGCSLGDFHPRSCAASGPKCHGSDLPGGGAIRAVWLSHSFNHVFEAPHDVSRQDVASSEARWRIIAIRFGCDYTGQHCMPKLSATISRVLSHFSNDTSRLHCWPNMARWGFRCPRHALSPMFRCSSIFMAGTPIFSVKARRSGTSIANCLRMAKGIIVTTNFSESGCGH